MALVWIEDGHTLNDTGLTKAGAGKIVAMVYGSCTFEIYPNGGSVFCRCQIPAGYAGEELKRYVEAQYLLMK